MKIEHGPQLITKCTVNIRLTAEYSEPYIIYDFICRLNFF